MHKRRRLGTPTALTVAAVWFLWTPLSAQPIATTPPSVAQATLDACSLMSSDEVAKLTGRRLFGDPDMTKLRGGSACTYGGGDAQIIVFSGERAGENFQALLRSFNIDQETRHPISGIGDSAYVMYPKPKNRYQDTVVLVAVTLRRHVAGVTVAADEGKSAETAQPVAIALAREVIGKLQ